MNVCRALRNAKIAAIAILLLSLVSNSCVAVETLTRTVSFEYEAATGLLSKEIVEPGDSELCLVKIRGYDSFGNDISTTIRGCNGSTGEAAAFEGLTAVETREIGKTYDARGQFPVASINALQQVERRTYDPNTGAVRSFTDPNNLTTTWQYDGFGRKTQESRADGTVVKWEYSYCYGINGGVTYCPSVGGVAAAWFVLEKSFSNDGVTQNKPISKIFYDALNREIRRETQGFDGTGATTAIFKDTQYDSLGRPYMVSKPYYSGQAVYWVTTSYDRLGRPIQETQPDNSTTTKTYNGLVTTTTNAKSQTTTTTLNAQGQVIKVVDAQNNGIDFTYDPHGNLKSTTDPQGNVVSYVYDVRGRKTQMIDPDMGSWSYAYNALDQLIWQTDGKGQVSLLAYDLLGRLTGRNEADMASFWYYDISLTS